MVTNLQLVWSRVSFCGYEAGRVVIHMANWSRQIWRDVASRIEADQAASLLTSFLEEGGSVLEDMNRILVKTEAEALQMCAVVDGPSRHFIESFLPQERLIILGGGHIAVPLVRIGRMLGFHVLVADDRPAFANQERFPDADSVLCESFDRVMAVIKPRGNDYVVIVTRGHRHDGTCIRRIFEHPETVYAGMIGSKRRVQGLKALLAEEGLDAGRLERICSPIGLPIGAVTPEEIAISIFGEIIRRRRSKAENPFWREEMEFDREVWLQLAPETDAPRCVATVLETMGSTPRGKGAKMLIFADGRTCGSIGGGCCEADVIRRARNLMGSGRYELVPIDMTGDVAESEGMVCGGTMRVLLEDVTTASVNARKL